jgi:hypothetical protein
MGNPQFAQRIGTFGGSPEPEFVRVRKAAQCKLERGLRSDKGCIEDRVASPARPLARIEILNSSGCMVGRIRSRAKYRGQPSLIPLRTQSIDGGFS